MSHLPIIRGELIPESADAYDFLMSGWTWEDFRVWAKSNSFVYGQVMAETIAKVEAVAEASQAQAIAAVQVNINPEETLRVHESMYAIWEKLGLACAKHSGQPVCNINNIVRVFEGMAELKGLVWFDGFHNKIFTSWNSEKPREWTDIDDLNLTNFLQNDIGLLKIEDEKVHKAVKIHAHKHITNEPKDKMESWAWDSNQRIDNFFRDYFGAEDSAYIHAASKNWWLSMVARVYRPGCKVDNMVILEGGQGKFKSTALSIIGGEWFTECHEQITNPNFYYVIQGKLLIEISELDAFSKAEVSAIKKVITNPSDRFRAVWGRHAKDHPRRCVFVGTTNEDEYLRDHTGGRRFWPVKIREIDIERLRLDREQLFAEAVYRFKAGETWWEMPLEQTLEQQEARRQSDEWEGAIADYLHNKHETTLKEVAVEAVKVDLAKLDLALQRRIGKILRVLRWHRIDKRVGKQVLKFWRPLPTESDDELLP